eukprot:742893-Amphidinium_carterae.2
MEVFKYVIPFQNRSLCLCPNQVTVEESHKMVSFVEQRPVVCAHMAPNRRCMVSDRERLLNALICGSEDAFSDFCSASEAMRHEPEASHTAIKTSLGMR